jgi:hypothetical protein
VKPVPEVAENGTQAPTLIADIAALHSVQIGTGFIDHASDHRALRRPNGSNVVARAVEAQVMRQACSQAR